MLPNVSIWYGILRRVNGGWNQIPLFLFILFWLPSKEQCGPKQKASHETLPMLHWVVNDVWGQMGTIKTSCNCCCVTACVHVWRWGLRQGIHRLHRCWWRMLETKSVGDNFEILVTDLRCWWPILYIEKATNMTNNVTKISKLSATDFVSNIRHQHRCSRWNPY